MQRQFLTYIQQEQLFKTTDTILLAVSGGVDSVVLCDLFHKAGLQFAIAHCNFNLRATESEDDETFVKKLAAYYQVPFHHIHFDTTAHAEKNKLSIQVAARELRYNWFEKIRTEHKYSYISTAHHQDDVIETFFINLIRGTGISGLRSIVPKQQYILRPLLFATKKQVLAYAKKNKISYREDSSNASDKYLRNKIRHHLIPVLNEFSPVAESAIIHSIEKLRDAEFIYKKKIQEVRSKICREEDHLTRINLTELKKQEPVSTYLYELLKPYGFNATTAKNILKPLLNKSGKQFFSATHRVLKDRNELLITPLTDDVSSQLFLIESTQTEFKTQGLQLSFEIKSPKDELFVHAKIAMLDFDCLEFPLHIRKWKTGDVFYPLGMKGKKKLSDFFIDKKLSLIDKKNTWLLCSNEKIAWVIGMRLDERFRMTEKTKKIFVVKFK